MRNLGLALLFLIAGCVQAETAFGTADYNRGYDEQRDPAADLHEAEQVAHQQHKLILMEVGGN